MLSFYSLLAIIIIMQIQSELQISCASEIVTAEEMKLEDRPLAELLEKDDEGKKSD